MTAVDHVLLTRFNLPSPGVEKRIRAQDGWLQGRVRLFEQFTLPAVSRQTRRPAWLVYFDPESPAWLRAWLRTVEGAGLFVPVFRAAVTTQNVIEDARRLIGQSAEMVMTTNLDNDDAVAHDFAERLHDVTVPHRRAAVYLENGLILTRERVYRHRDPVNAFCSVREPWDEAVTCWADWHNLLPRQMPSVQVSGPPAWLQVIHHTNVSNRVRGRLVRPEVHRVRFGSSLDGIAEPSLGALLTDALVHRPGRQLRDLSRVAVKTAVLQVGGKAALDRLKLAVHGERSAVKPATPSPASDRD